MLPPSSQLTKAPAESYGDTAQIHERTGASMGASILAIDAAAAQVFEHASMQRHIAACAIDAAHVCKGTTALGVRMLAADASEEWSLASSGSSDQTAQMQINASAALGGGPLPATLQEAKSLAQHVATREIGPLLERYARGVAGVAWHAFGHSTAMGGNLPRLGQLVAALAGSMLCECGREIHAMVPLLQHRSEALRGAAPHLALASLLLGNLCQAVPSLQAACQAIEDDEAQEVMFYARHRVSRHGLQKAKGPLPVSGAIPGDACAARDPEAMIVVRAVRLLVRAASAALGALSVGPEVEEEEEGWMSAWLSSGMFDGGMQDVPCSAMGPDDTTGVPLAQGGRSDRPVDTDAVELRLESAMDEVEARRRADVAQ